MSQSLHPMLNIAIKAARAAGAIINRGSQDLDLLTVTHKGPNDFVSEIDQAAEAAIIETLLTAYPGHGILAEESGRAHGAKHSEYMWIIDPLDGTTNFLHGFPVYCVSIALAWRGVVQQAVVYDPCRNDLFYASRGRGAFLNDRRLRVSKRIRLADALIGTGFPFRRGDNFQRYMKMFETMMQSCAGLRRPGAAALDLCYVAAGWYDGFFETGLNPWDMAAGSLIVTEAGGLIGNFTGEADFLFQREVVAGSPKVYGQMIALLAPYSKAIKMDEPAEESAASAADASDAVAAALARSLAGSADVDTAAATDEPTVERTPERIRKPVRIRRAEPEASADNEATAQAASTTDATIADPAAPAAPVDAKAVPTVSYKPPTPPGTLPERDRKPPRLGERKARGPNPDIGRPRTPRPDGDRSGPPRPEGDRPRGPRPDGGARSPARPGQRPAFKTRPKG